jgi:hypothetical protein
MSRVENKKVTSVVDYDPTETIAADVEYYRVNDVDDPDYILEKYLNGEHKEQFNHVEFIDWYIVDTLYESKTEIINYNKKLYEIVYTRYIHNPLQEEHPQIFSVTPKKVEKTEYIRT